MMVKRKRVQTENQRKASRRNWSKGSIKGMIGQFHAMRVDNVLSFNEQMKVLKCLSVKRFSKIF